MFAADCGQIHTSDKSSNCWACVEYANGNETRVRAVDDG
jgi:hypothetical protein